MLGAKNNPHDLSIAAWAKRHPIIVSIGGGTVVLLLTLLILLFADWQSSLLPSCESDYRHQDQEKRQAAQKHCPTFEVFAVARLYRVGGGVGDFIEDNHNAIVALFTIVVACFTGTLWWATRGLRKSTDKLWEAAEKQSLDFQESLKIAGRAATAAEEQGKDFKASLGIAALTAAATADSVNMAGKQVRAARHDAKAWIYAGPRVGSWETKTEIIAVTLIVKNYGRTLGLVTKVCVNTSETVPSGDPNTYKYAPEAQTYSYPLGPEEPWTKLNFSLPKGHDFMFGFVEYLDVFEQTFVTRFCDKIDRRARECIPAGDPAWSDLGSKKKG